MLYRLAEGPQNAGKLATTLKISLPTVSRHHKVLGERGMVGRTRYGATIEYRLIDYRPIQALDLIRSVLHDNLTRSAELVDIQRKLNDGPIESLKKTGALHTSGLFST